MLYETVKGMRHDLITGSHTHRPVLSRVDSPHPKIDQKFNPRLTSIFGRCLVDLGANLGPKIDQTSIKNVSKHNKLFDYDFQSILGPNLASTLIKHRYAYQNVEILKIELSCTRELNCWRSEGSKIIQCLIRIGPKSQSNIILFC